MELNLTKKSGFTVVGMKYTGPAGGAEIPKLWDRFAPKIKTVPNRVDKMVCFGVCHNFDKEKGVFDYLAAVEVSQTDTIPEGMEVWEIPTQTYAVFPCTLPVIKETFDKIYSEFLPGSGHTCSGGPELEFYDDRFDPQAGKLDLEIWIPVIRDSK